MSAHKSVVVTGIGLVTPFAAEREPTWRKIRQGASAASMIKQFDSSGWPSQLACEVPNFQMNQSAALPSQLELLNRPNQFAMTAAWEAIDDAKFLTPPDSERFGIFTGVGIGVIKPAEILNLLRELPDIKELKGIMAHLIANQNDPSLLLRNHPGTLALLLSQRWKARAFATTVSTACAASAQAIGRAKLAIERGMADIVLAGGADSIAGELLNAGFCMLGVLSTENHHPRSACRPFDKSRQGFVPGEGAGFLVLESEKHAQQRNAKIYGSLCGYGESENAYRLTELPEDGRGAISAMKLALLNAALNPKDIGYINAHGTGTEQNDRIEAHAIEKLFYDASAHPAVSSSKSQIGHLVAAAGAVEAAISLLALRDQVLPPSINLETPCSSRIDFVANQERKTSNLNFVQSNSFGFGGSNASLVFGRRHD